MTTLKLAKGSVELDDDGFLVNSEEWSDDVARAMAQREDIRALSAEQLDIIHFLRNYYNKHHSFPILNFVCKTLDKERGCMNEEFLNPMVAWKLAGLPKPEGVRFVSVDGSHYMMEECC